jgi:hypothetical protein
MNLTAGLWVFRMRSAWTWQGAGSQTRSAQTSSAPPWGVAKLSSVSTILAACLETPRRTYGHPDVSGADRIPGLVRSGSTIPASAAKTRPVTAAIGLAGAVGIAASSMSLAANVSTQPVLGQLAVGGQDLLPDVRGWTQLAVPQRVRAALPDHVGHSLHGCEIRLGDDWAGQPAGAIVEDGHPPRSLPNPG